MTPFASAFAFVLAVVALGFVLRAVTRRKPPLPAPALTAEIRPYRCGCVPKSAHPLMGARPIPCTDDEADWWFASEDQGNLCLWNERFNCRADAEQALAERGWKAVQQFVRAPESGEG